MSGIRATVGAGTWLLAAAGAGGREVAAISAAAVVVKSSNMVSRSIGNIQHQKTFPREKRESGGRIEWNGTGEAGLGNLLGRLGIAQWATKRREGWATKGEVKQLNTVDSGQENQILKSKWKHFQDFPATAGSGTVEELRSWFMFPVTHHH